MCPYALERNAVTARLATEDAASVDIETLVDDRESLDTALEGTDGWPLAVVGDPFAGREVVLDYAAAQLDATRFSLDPGADVGAVREALGDGPVVIDGCQQLYERRIGGFAPLEEFLRLLATADTPVVAGWNRYAWAYLTRVRELDEAFATHVDVGPVSAERLAELLLARYDTAPEFVAEEPDRDGPVTVRRFEVTVAGRPRSLPVPVPTALLAESSPPNPRDVVFERLAAASGGNVGVAAALWEQGRGETMRPSDVGVPEDDLSLDRDESFCLRVLLAKERVARDELAALVDSDLDRILDRLRRAGLATQSAAVVSLDPARLPAAITHTEKRRIL